MRARNPIALAALLALVSCTSGGSGGSHRLTDAAGEAERRAQLDAARAHLKHVVFIVKENRTFDTLFGRFPGADGDTEGRT